MDRGTKGAHQSPAARAQRACSVSAQTANREQNEARRARASIQVSELTSGMKQRTIQTLYAYWNELRAGRIAPRRLEIEPVAHRLDPARDLHARAHRSRHVPLSAGRHATLRNISAELRGTNILDGWTEPRSRRHCTPPGFACEQGAVTLLTIEASADTTRRVQLEAILLPLMHANNAMERVIGAMSCDDIAALAGPRAADRQAPDPARADLAGWAAARARRADSGTRHSCPQAHRSVSLETNDAAFVSSTAAAASNNLASRTPRASG